MRLPCINNEKIIRPQDKSSFHDTERPFQITEWPFQTTEWPFRITERRFLLLKQNIYTA